MPIITKHGSTLFLKIVIFLIALGAVAFMVRFPQTEGRAAGLDLINIYKDPFIIYMYIASIPFFVALYQAFKLLGYVDKNKIFSKDAVRAAAIIKYCAIAIVVLVFLSVCYLFIVQRGKDDIAGGVAAGLFIIFTSLVIANIVAIFQQILKNTTDIKSEKT